jgi:hypothetical protein
MTEFADAPTPNATLAATRTGYLANGGECLELPNRSRHPRIAFFDTAENPNEQWQIVHSKLVAALLKRCMAKQPDLIAGGAPHARQ